MKFCNKIQQKNLVSADFN